MDISDIRSYVSFNKKQFKYLVITFFLYLLFLIVNLPASIVLSSVTLPANLSYSTVSGSVWSGKLQQVRYRGVSLGTVNWELSPFNLLLAELSSDISVVNNKQFLNTELTISYSGKIELQETRFSVDLSLLQPLTYGMPFSYDGKASGYFPVSYFHKNNHIGLNGKLSLSSLAMISPQQQVLGNFAINFRAENEGATSGKIKDTGGPLNISGQLSLKKNGLFTVSAKLASREAGSSLEQAIAFLGAKDSSGRVQLNSSFKLWR